MLLEYHQATHLNTLMLSSLGSWPEFSTSNFARLLARCVLPEAGGPASTSRGWDMRREIKGVRDGAGMRLEKQAADRLPRFSPSRF